MEDQFDIRKEKLKKIESLGIPAYPYGFDKTHRLQELRDRYGDRSAEELEKLEDRFRCTGRILSQREMGKSAFLHLFDGEEPLQIYIRKDVVSEKDFQLYKLLDIGDIIGLSGRVFKTKSNELTILVESLTFLAKSLHPLPEKWHGLQDKELRFRHRFLDLIGNPETRRVFQIRARIMQTIRSFFLDRGYMEVETPMMQPIPGGAAARPFVTHHNALDIDLFLRIAPELYLKRLLVGGIEKIFEVNRNFRNEGISLMHNPEFTMLEFYELYRDVYYYMELTEKLLTLLGHQILGDQPLARGELTIALKTPFRRVKYMDLLAAATGISVEDLWQEDTLRQYVKKRFPEEDVPPTFGKLLDILFDHLVEDHLIDPTFVTDYPKAISPLSKVSRLDIRETERFELFIAGMEIANGFSELNDPVDQRQRFEAQAVDKQKGDDEAHAVDESFLFALEHGMAPAAGEGIGIDRLVMLFSGASSIKEVIFFPLLRPKE